MMPVSMKDAVDSVQKVHNAYWTEEQIELAARVSARLLELGAQQAAGLNVDGDIAVVKATAATIAQGNARLVGTVLDGAIAMFLGNIIRAAVIA